MHRPDQDVTYLTYLGTTSLTRWVFIPGDTLGPTDSAPAKFIAFLFNVGISNPFCNNRRKNSLHEPKWILLSSIFRFTSATMTKTNPSPRLPQCRTPPPVVRFGITDYACGFNGCIWAIYTHSMSRPPNYWRRYSYGLVFGIETFTALCRDSARRGYKWRAIAIINLI